MIIQSNKGQIEQKRQFFNRACRMFGLDSSYVSEVLLGKRPEFWASEFGSGVKGGKAASFLSLSFARVMCAEGNHQLEYQLSLAAAKRVTTGEAPAYRDAWQLVLKQARMERQITASAGDQTTGRNCCKLVNPPQTEGVLLLPRFGSPY